MANLQQVWLSMTMEKKESYTKTRKHTIYHYTENRHELEEISLNEINYIIHFWLAKTLSEMCYLETKHVITLHFQNIWVHLWGHMAFWYTKKICKHFSAIDWSTCNFLSFLLNFKTHIGLEYIAYRETYKAHSSFLSACLIFLLLVFK